MQHDLNFNDHIVADWSAINGKNQIELSTEEIKRRGGIVPTHGNVIALKRCRYSNYDVLKRYIGL